MLTSNIIQKSIDYSNLCLTENINNKNLKFVVQEHDAEKAGKHYDLRLEYNGVLKSWACRKLPEIVSGKKKKIMIFQTEDHKMDWLNFSGEIESGYGKGYVSIWDKGKYSIKKWDMDKIIEVEFKGNKLKGHYAIVPYNPNNRKKQDSFLLVKKS